MKKFTNKMYSLEVVNHNLDIDAGKFVSKCETDFNKLIKSLAHEITHKQDRVKIIMLNGPSASGKTTTAKKLSDEFERLGIGAVDISLDNFFLPEEKTPKDEYGKPDFESVHALDVENVKCCIDNIIETGECVIPKFSFRSKNVRNKSRKISLDEHHIAIIEGLHALNPIFTENRSHEGIVKMYVSVKDGINYNGKELFSKKDLRFLRRLVRDNSFRKANAEFTFEIWDSVCRGERKNINPYKNEADYLLNSTHPYEASIMGKRAIPLLKTIKPDNVHYEKAQQLISGILLCAELDEKYVPQESLLREFIGGGIYKY